MTSYADAAYAINDEVEFERYPGSWYRATVTAINDSEAQIHLHGFGWSDWTPFSKLRTAPADSQEAPPIAEGDDEERINALYQRHEQMTSRVSYRDAPADEGTSQTNAGGDSGLAARLAALETRCQMEASARATLEKELQAQKNINKQTGSALGKIREELVERRAEAAAIQDRVDAELAPVRESLDQQERDVADQREALEALMDTIEGAVTHESMNQRLVEHEGSMEKKMEEYWDREMDGIVLDAELEEVRLKITEQTDFLVEHVTSIETQLNEEQAEDKERLDKLEDSCAQLGQLVSENAENAETMLAVAQEEMLKNTDSLADDVVELNEKCAKADGMLVDLIDSKKALDSKVEGFDCRLHARLDSEMAYMKEKVDQGMQLLVTRLDGEVKVINDRTEHVRQATTCIDGAVCRLDAKLDATVVALDKQIEQFAVALDEQLSSVTEQVDASLVELHGRLDAFTKEVQQFVVESALEKEVGRAAMTSLNNKIDAVLRKLMADVANCASDGNRFTTEQCGRIETDMVGRVERMGVRVDQSVKELNTELAKVADTATANAKEIKNTVPAMSKQLNKLEQELGAKLTAEIAEADQRLSALSHSYDESAKRTVDNIDKVNQRVLSQDKRLEKCEIKTKDVIPSALSELHMEIVGVSESTSEQLASEIEVLNKQVNDNVLAKLRVQSGKMKELDDKIVSTDKRLMGAGATAKTISMMVDEVKTNQDELQTLVMDVDEKCGTQGDALSELEVDVQLMKMTATLQQEDSA